MRAHDPAAWVPFFTAIIAAAAGLAGLLFVAVSINLDRRLKGARFPGGGRYEWRRHATFAFTLVSRARGSRSRAGLRASRRYPATSCRA